MGDPKQDEGLTPSTVKAGRRRRVIVAVLGLTLLAVLVGAWLSLALLGDPTERPDGLPIDNRTATDLLIYDVIREAGFDAPVTNEVLVARVPAHSEVATGMECGRSELVARTADGEQVAVRRSESCDETVWVIG